MKVIIDGIEDMVSPEGEATVGEFVKNLRNWLKSQGRSFIGITGDTVAVEPRAYGAFAAQPIDQVRVLEIVTMDRNQKLVDILTDITGHIPSLTSALGEVVRYIHQAGHEKAFQLFSQCLETLNAVNDAFAETADLLELDYSEVVVGKTSIQEKMKSLAVVIGAALESFEQKDYVRLADVLEYDLLPHIAEFEQAARKLSAIALAKIPRT